MESMADVLSFVNRQKVSHAIIIKRRSRTDAWCLTGEDDDLVVSVECGIE